MLAVAEDSTAAQLMGIRPDTMQAIAWAIAAGATGLAGALIANFFYIVPTVGETLGIVAFVTVSLGGFGSVPGALVAGLLIGVIESLSGYLIGAVYKDIVVYVAVPVLPLVPAARPDGQALMRKLMRRLIWLSVGARTGRSPIRCCCPTPFQQRLGALVLLYAIAARPGTSSAAMPARSRSAMSCSSAAAPMPRWGYAHFGLSPLVGIPAGIVFAVRIAAVIGVPTLRLSGHYFSMATIAVAELVRLIVTNTEYLGAAVGLTGPTVPRNVFDLSFISSLPYYYLFLAVLVITLVHHLVDDQQPDGILSARHQGFRARGALARRAREPHQALRLHAERGADQRRRRALCDDVRLRRSGVRARHPDLGEDPDHGGARRRGPAVRSAGRRRDPGAAGGDLQQLAWRQGRRPHLRASMARSSC